MRTLQKSVGNFVFLGAIFILSTLVGCSSSSNRAKYEQSSDEYSLKKDRSYLNDLRKNVPEEKRKENDSLAFIFELFDEGSSPSSIRSRFNKEVRRSRDKFRKDQKALLDEFNREEKRKRY